MKNEVWRRCYDLLERCGERLRTAHTAEEQVAIFAEAVHLVKGIADEGGAEMAVALGIWAALEHIGKQALREEVSA